MIQVAHAIGRRIDVWRTMARLVSPATAASAWHTPRTETERWRALVRPKALRLIAERTTGLPWTNDLLTLLLDELYVEDLFTVLVGPPHRLPASRYAQAVAVAIALRHSWRPDDLADVAQRLGVRLPPTAVEHLPPRLRSTNHGGPRRRKRASRRKKRRPERLSAATSRPAP